ncbi:MAG: methyl-accepting chemotaxis protein [Pseudomonadota bacterium]
MLKKLSLRLQLNLGFGTVLLLLLILSIVAYLGLRNVYNGYVEYRGLARDTNLAGRVQANMLSMRLAVIKYINNQSPEALADYSSRRELMLNYLEEAKTQIKDPTRAKLVSNVAAGIFEYEQAFDKVVELYGERNEIVNKTLNPSGLSMRKATTDIIVSAYDDGDSEAAYYAALLQQHLLLARLYAAKYLVTNEATDADRAHKELTEKMPYYLGKLDQALENSLRREKLSSILANHKAFQTSFNQIENIITARNNYIDNTLNLVGPEIAKTIEEVKLSVKKEQDTLGPALQNNSQFSLNTVIIVSLLALVAGSIISITITHNIRRPIGGEPAEIEEITRKIAEGDLTQAFTPETKDTGIYRSVVDMSSKLKQLIGAMVTTCNELISSANSSTDMSEANAEYIAEQKVMGEKVLLAIEELSKSFRQVAKNASACASKSEQGIKETADSRDSIKTTVDAVSKLAANLNHSMTVIQNLEEQSTKIDSVVEVINNISEQTNLLALNAAIEAARAGEQGRGFAVVADEVRSLAQRTQESTTEIQQIIQNLQSGTAETVRSMETSTMQVQETVDRSNETDKALGNIHKMIQEIADMNIQVATATEEQSVVSEEISQRMSKISETINITSDSMAKAKVANQGVKTMAEELHKLAGMFNLDSSVGRS